MIIHTPSDNIRRKISFDPGIAFCDFDDGPIGKVSKLVLDLFKLDIELIIQEFELLEIDGLNIYPFIVDRRDFFASSKLIDGVDIASISIGSILSLYELIGRIIHNDRFFIRNSNFSINNRTSVFYPQDVPYISISNFEDFSTDEYGHLGLIYMTIQSSKFLLHHELAHIWNGHLGRKLSNQQLADNKENSHMLELDADSQAIRGIIKSVFKTGIRYDGMMFFPINQKRKLYLSICATYLAVRYTAFLKPNETKIHPSAKYRLAWLMEYWMWYLVHDTNLNKKTAIIVISDAITRVENSFCLSVNTEKFDILNNNFLHQSELIRSSLLNNWGNLRSELKAHHRGFRQRDIKIFGDLNGSPQSMLSYLPRDISVGNDRIIFEISKEEWMDHIARTLDRYLKKISKSSISDDFIENIEYFYSLLNSCNLDLRNFFIIDSDNNLKLYHKKFIEKCRKIWNGIFKFEFIKDENLRHDLSCGVYTCVYSDDILRYYLIGNRSEYYPDYVKIEVSKCSKLPLALSNTIGNLVFQDVIDFNVERFCSSRAVNDNCYTLAGSSLITLFFLNRIFGHIRQFNSGNSYP